ncbi:MAG: hypothetical protein AAGF13_09000 [Pseudomonadota bacterium]
MTLTDFIGSPVTTPVAAPEAKTNPPRTRMTPPLLMGDILQARNGVPIFVSEWLRLEKERDERRAAKHSHPATDAADRL